MNEPPRHALPLIRGASAGDGPGVARCRMPLAPRHSVRLRGVPGRLTDRKIGERKRAWPVPRPSCHVRWIRSGRRSAAATGDEPARAEQQGRRARGRDDGAAELRAAQVEALVEEAVDAEADLDEPARERVAEEERGELEARRRRCPRRRRRRPRCRLTSLRVPLKNRMVAPAEARAQAPARLPEMVSPSMSVIVNEPDASAEFGGDVRDVHLEDHVREARVVGRERGAVLGGLAPAARPG
jgi:hypothetical protein